MNKYNNKREKKRCRMDVCVCFLLYKCSVAISRDTSACIYVVDVPIQYKATSIIQFLHDGFALDAAAPVTQRDGLSGPVIDHRHRCVVLYVLAPVLLVCHRGTLNQTPPREKPTHPRLFAHDALQKFHCRGVFEPLLEVHLTSCCARHCFFLVVNKERKGKKTDTKRWMYERYTHIHNFISLSFFFLFIHDAATHRTCLGCRR